MADQLENVALRKLLFGIADDVDAADDDVTIIDAAVAVIDQYQDLEAENQELRGRLAEIENQIDTIQELGTKKTTKEEKIAQLVTYAENQRGAQTDRVALTVKEITGVTGVSRRYAYDLLDDLPSAYEWLLDRSDVSQYGDLEIDKDSQDRALIIDFEQLHKDDGAVNKFTTRTTTEGASA